EAMTECFIEEFMLMGYNHKQILALFRNPHYLGMNLVLQNCGEQVVRTKITEIFARWGRPIQCPGSGSSRREEALHKSEVRGPKSELDLSVPVRNCDCRRDPPSPRPSPPGEGEACADPGNSHARL